MGEAAQYCCCCCGDDAAPATNSAGRSIAPANEDELDELPMLTVGEIPRAGYGFHMPLLEVVATACEELVVV